MKGVTDPGNTVPFQAVQEIPDRMVAVPVRNDMKCFFDHLQGTDAVGPFAVKMDVVKVVVREGLAGTATVPPERLHDIDPLRQLVEPDRSTKQRIIRQDQLRVRDTAFDLTLLGRFQKILHILRRHFRL